MGATVGRDCQPPTGVAYDVGSLIGKALSYEEDAGSTPVQHH